ncbi:MAG: tetratricopeptide repeat protein [Pseudomonadota bacterium]
MKKSSDKRTKTKPKAGQNEFIALVQQAQLLFSQGRMQQALQITIRILTIDPHNGALLNFAGVCAIRLDDYEQAEHFWRQAIISNPESPEAYFNLGLLLAKREHKIEAEQCYRQAIEFNPNYPEAYCNLGNLLDSWQRKIEAEECYRQAVTLNPNFEEAYHNLGNMLIQRNQPDEAEKCYRQAISLNAHNTQALSNLGLLLAKRKQTEEAERCYRQAIAIDPSDAEAHSNLGLLLTNTKQYDDAEYAFRLAISINSNVSEIHANLGNLLAKRRRNEDAEKCYRQAITINPNSAAAYCNLGVLLADQWRDEEAERGFRQAIALNPDYGLARLNLGYLLLSQGNWEEAWAYHEVRYVRDSPDQETIFPDIPFPQWQGETLLGKSLVVWLEQGYGDVINFCRYIPLLKAEGATHITIVCRPSLKPLLETLTGVDTLLDADNAEALPLHDYWTFLLSIPYRRKTTVDTVPHQIPYLSASPERIAEWTPRLPNNGLRVGLVWKGNPTHNNDAQRSLSHFSVLAPLWSVPGINFISLQKGQGEDEAQYPSEEQPLLHLGSDVRDFSDVAAIVTQLDLVICVDTAIAHLAGALGKPCWVMLPIYKTDWRWLRNRNDSPWYPATMRLFRQQKPDDWAAVIMNIKEALVALKSA